MSEMVLSVYSNKRLASFNTKSIQKPAAEVLSVLHHIDTIGNMERAHRNFLCAVARNNLFSNRDLSML